MYTFMSINGSSGSCHPRRDAELIPICNRLLTDLHVIRKMKLYIFGGRDFRVFAPFLWNDLPVFIRQTESIVNLKKTLKTHLFVRHFR